MEMRLGAYRQAVEQRLRTWRGQTFGRRLWDKDYRLWSAEPVPELSDRLGWLDLPRGVVNEVAVLEALAGGVRAEGMQHVVLFGMGGSSLAPEVFQAVFGNAPGSPALTVLDSTHPDAADGGTAEGRHRPRGRAGGQGRAERLRPEKPRRLDHAVPDPANGTRGDLEPPGALRRRRHHASGALVPGAGERRLLQDRLPRRKMGFPARRCDSAIRESRGPQMRYPWKREG